MVHGINKTYWENLKELGFEEFLDEAIADGRIKNAGFSQTLHSFFFTSFSSKNKEKEVYD